MTATKISALAPVVVLALALAACGGRSAKEEAAAIYCPKPLTVSDAARLTRFKAGPGRDPRDVVYEAQLLGADTACKIGRARMDVDLKMRVAVNAGPSVAGGVSSVPYFVRVLDGRGTVVQGHEFNADFKLSPANPRGQSMEELTVTLPYSDVTDIGGYRIAVGLMPTPEELEYNRRGAARP